MNTKGHDRVPWSLFLKTPSPYTLLLKPVLIRKPRVTSWGCQSTLLSSCSCNTLTLYSLWGSLNSCLSWFMSVGTLCVNRVQGTGSWYPKTGFASWWVLSQKTQSSQSMGGRRIYHLQQVMRTMGIFPKAVPPEQQNWGSFVVFF